MSVLGLAHYHQRARTGVYRVVENVAIGGIASGECEMVGYASLGNDDACREYLAAHPLLASCEKDFVPGMSTAEHLIMQQSGIAWLLQRITAKLVPATENNALTLPHVNICHSPFFPIPEIILADRRIAKVQTVHDLIPLLFPHLFAFNDDDLIRRVLAGIGPDTFVVCMSESTRNDFLAYKKDIDPERVSVVYSAASESFQHCSDQAAIEAVRAQYNIPPGVQYILSVSTLEPRKNIDQAVRCFVRLVTQESIDDLYLVLTGTAGWHFDKIFAEIESSAELRHRIILTGFVPDNQLAPLYSGALAFVYPSLYEGFGLPPLEAMQCGTPVITSNTSSLPEVVGDAGIMVGPADGDALCQAMLSLYGNAALRQEMSRKSLVRAKAFSWENTTRKMLDVYRMAAQ